MVNGRGVPYVLVPSPPIKPSGGLIPYVLVPSRTPKPPPKPSGRATPYVLVPSIPQKRKASPTPGSASPDPSPKKRREEANLPDSAGSSSENNIEYTEDELEDDAPLDSRGGIPVRKLSGFCIFEGQDLVSTTELLGGIFGRSFTASGLARDHHLGSTSDDDDEDDCGLFVKGLQITELDLHHVSKEGIVDNDVYIKTERAWYILNTPANIYRPFFIPLWIRHQFTRLIVASALNNPTTTYAEFVDSLPKPLTETELKSVEVIEYFKALLIVIASDLKETTKRNINSVPLVKTLQSAKFSKHLEIPKELTVVKAFVTPIVGRVVMPHITCAMSVVGSDLAELEQVPVKEVDAQPYEHDHDDPKTMRWGNRLSRAGYYDSVTIDGVIYRIGDVVSVNPGQDEDDQRAQSALLSAEFCANSYAQRVWFIRIEYFFEDEVERDGRGLPTKKLHGVWFAHGSDTILQQFNHSEELFLLEECDDIKVSSIYRKCSVCELGPMEREHPDTGDNKSTTYFYRLVWDGDEVEFKDPPTFEEQERVKSLLPAHMPCVNCGFTEEEELRHKLLPLSGTNVPDGFTQFGYSYHPGDFVLIKPKTDSPCPLLVGQIIDIQGLSGEWNEDGIICSIRYFKRYTEGWMEVQDDRRLYRTRHTNKVKAKDLDGVCFVKFIDEANVDAIQNWLDGDDHFYVNTYISNSRALVPMEEEDFELCQPCARKHEREMEQYHLRNEPITSLDVFSGAGGLSEGMSKTGFFETKWAIEQSASAALTFAANHPNTNVLCADVNDVLKYIIERQEGKVPTPLRSYDGSIIPDEDIPRQGDVELVIGGPPCQSFSVANVYRKEDDVRSTLPYTLLGLVEALQPTYFLLENVTGLMFHALTGSGKRVEMATLKLIERVLLALGYQVRFKVLQASQYGTAQDRERVIFLGAKRGHKLPEFPIPTHTSLKPARQWKIPLRRRDRIRPPTRSRTDEVHLYAPHPAVTVNDAIDDLPPFEWVNPHLRIPETPQDREEQLQRKRQGILQCTVSKLPVGFPDSVAFEKQPRTRYQRMMRRRDGLVDNHVTQAFSDLIVELTTMVPLKPWSNHRFLPQELLPETMKRPGNSSIYYGRLDGTSYFNTAMTVPKPHGSKSHFIHPWQKRALSLREFARSQGFPDSYIFCSTESTQNGRFKDFCKQIGNAVPVPLAAALGRSIGAALVHDWRKRNRREASMEC